MNISNVLDTKNYEVFDLSYGVLLINLNKENGLYKNVFFQGDDALEFLGEIEKIHATKTEDKFIDSWLSEYDHVMQTHTEDELAKIGVTISKKSSIKLK